MVIGVGGIGLAAILAILLITVDLSFRNADWARVGFVNYAEVFLDAFVYKALLNTFGFAGVTVLTATVFGVPIAWLAERTDLPGRTALFPLMSVGLLMPGFFNAMGWLLLLHPRIGVLNRWLTELLGLAHAPFNVVSVGGMGFVQGLGLSSLIFIMCVATFRAMDSALEESAQIHGLGLLTRLRTIVLPVLWPGLLAAIIYAFMLALGLFDVPAVIGLANRVYTYSTFVYSLTNPSASGSPDYGLSAASSVLMVLIALRLAAWYARIVRRSHRYAVVTGRSYRPRPIRLGRWAIAAWAFVAGQALLALVLPGAVLLWASIQPVYGPLSLRLLAHASLANYTAIDWSGFWAAARNSAIVVIAAPTITIVLSLAISWVVVRARSKILGPLFSALSFVPLAIPSVVFAVGAIAFAVFWLPASVPFYGTVAIIVAVEVIIQISFATRVLGGALMQIHQELDEAGTVFGLPPVAVIWRILRPLLMPAILNCWVWIALLCYRELTVSTMLVAEHNVTLPVFIWSLFSGGNIGQSAAVTIILAAAMLPVIVVYFVIGRRSLATLGS
jgi:iron(III) transport system permease protein